MCSIFHLLKTEITLIMKFSLFHNTKRIIKLSAITMLLCTNSTIMFGDNTDFSKEAAIRYEAAKTKADIDEDKRDSLYNAMALGLDSMVTNPVQQSVVDAIVGKSYYSLARSRYSSRNQEAKKEYMNIAAQRMRNVLKDMNALAEANGKDFEQWVVLGVDGKIFNHDMLYVILHVVQVDNSSAFTMKEKIELFQKAAELYKTRGNINAYALTMADMYNLQRIATLADGRIDFETYSKNMRALLDEVKNNEVGADIAMSLADNMVSKDDKILFLKWAVNNVGSSKRKGDLKTELTELLRPKLSEYSYTSIVANKPFNARFDYWNVKNASIIVREYAGTIGKSGTLSNKGALVKRYDLELGNDSANIAREEKGLPVEGSKDLSITLPVGRYAIECVGPVSHTQELVVTSMRLVIFDNKDGHDVYAVDNETGRPLQGIDIEQQYTKQNEIAYSSIGKTNANGMLRCEIRNAYIRAKRSDVDYTSDIYLGISYLGNKTYGTPSISSNKGVTAYHGNIMKDRSIYRPGQKMNFGCVLYGQAGDDVKAVAEEIVSVEVKTPRGKLFMEKELTTDKWGNASFAVDLPSDAEVGDWRITLTYKGNNIWASARVEEYKRPTFDIDFDKDVKAVTENGVDVKTGFALGDSILLSGKAMMFNGIPVQSAKVSYTVECMPMSWFRYSDNWRSVDSGDTTTDADGGFVIPVKLTDKFISTHSFVQFRVKAKVTDMAGETHEKNWSTMVSKQAFAINIKCDDFIDLNGKNTFVVNASDMNNQPYSVKGSYKIVRDSKEVASGTFDSNTDVSLPKSLPAGAKYGIEVEVADENGGKIRENAYFSVYDSSIPVTEVAAIGTKESKREDDERCDDIFYSPQSKYQAGGDVDLYFSTKETDTYIYYYVYSNDKVLEKHQFVTDGRMKHFKLKHSESWGLGISVVAAYVRDGNPVSVRRDFTLEEPEKKLNLNWESFRDNLLPGQNEKWTLRITDKDGKAVSGASVLATMYDASLDMIKPHSWNFELFFYRSTPSARSNTGYDVRFPSYNCQKEYNYKDLYFRKFDRMFMWGNPYNRDEMMFLESGSVGEALQDMVPGLAVRQNKSMKLMAVSSSSNMVEADDDISFAFFGDDEAVVKPTDAGFSKVSLRKEFAETALFAPALVSDANGDVNISFSLPDALTQWKFMALAHTQDIDYGLITAEAVSKKPFMIRPNMPRFVRWGDKVVIASSIVNQSESRQKGKVRLRLINPETEEEVICLVKSFDVDANKTEGVNFSFKVKDGWEGMNCEIIALGDKASDGEMNYLPVLSSKIELVETVPFFIVGKNDIAGVSKSVDLSAMFNSNSPTAINRDMKIEYTDNPSWMCIEALRSVKNPTCENAVCFASSFYANATLISLMKSFPILESSENKQELENRAITACTKLAELQKEDGSWSWFSGMEGNYYITLSVCEMLAKMHNRTGIICSGKIEKMLFDGLAYLDKESLESYKEMKKDTKKSERYYTNSDCRYLYTSSLVADRKVKSGVESMRDGYLSLIESDIENLTIYGVANISCVLRSFGREKSADKFVDFMKKYVVEKPNQGRCFTTERAQYSWMDYRIPTQVAAMNAIYRKDKSDSLLNDMQLWLIAQKQVQKWDNELNTIDVADLLLKISPAETFHSAEKPEISVDGVAIKNFDYGTMNKERDELEGKKSNLVIQGNVIADVDKSIIADGTKVLKVTKKTPSISWGAVYATSLESISKVNSYATNELKVERKIYVQKFGSDDWAEYNPSNGKSSDSKISLNIGDKVRVRSTITADRDMDFVHVNVSIPACFEPVNQVSGYRWMGGRGGYIAHHDSCSDLYFDKFTRGSATVDTYYNIVRAGDYEFGISTVKCEYATQFGGHTGSFVMSIEK